MKAILFDMDGTLGGYGFGNGLYLQQVSAQVAAAYPQHDFGDDKSFLTAYRSLVNHCWGAWVKKELLLEREQVKVHIFERLLHQHGMEEATAQTLAVELQAGLAAAYPDHIWQPVPGITDVLTWAKETGAVLGVISNGHLEEQTGKLRDHGLLGFFDHLIVSTEVGVGKPDVRIFEHALQVCGCEAHEALMIGDSYSNDIEPAKQLGMRTIWVYEDALILGLPERDAVADIRDVPQHVATFSSTF
ncbi:MAG: HAD family hydrolase [Tumebacillaceae bacterium]